MEKPQVAVIGAGYWGKNIVRGLHQLGALACICDANGGLLGGYREAYPQARLVENYAVVLADKGIKAVAIAAPAAAHGEMIRLALEAGKDVCVEKPLCLSEKEGEELVRLADERGRVLMVGHLLQYHGAVAKLRELVASGELGKLQYIYSNRLNLGKIRSEENVLWSFAPHDISVILALAGEMPEEVSCTGGQFLQRGIADASLASMSFPSGARAHIFVSWLNPFKEQRLVVAGSRKMAVFDDTRAEGKLVLYPHVITWKGNLPAPEKKDGEPVGIDGSEPLKAELAHFIECVEKRQTPRTDGREGLRVLRVLQACQESMAAGGKTVRAGEKPSPPAPLPEGEGLKKPYFAHQTAVIDEPASIGEGTSIWHFSHVMKGSEIGRSCNIGQNVVISPDVKIGDRVKIQNNVSVYSGVVLEDGVFCGPSMVFTNVINPRSFIPRKDEYRSTVVRRGATLGANCTVVCGHTIGAFAFVGAGSVVTRDVPDYALVTGNPARITGFMCECGVKLAFRGFEAECPACGAAYEKTDNKVTRRTSERSAA